MKLKKLEGPGPFDIAIGTIIHGRQFVSQAGKRECDKAILILEGAAEVIKNSGSGILWIYSHKEDAPKGSIKVPLSKRKKK